MSCLSTVISIVPRLPPSIDGVGDYALNLARQLRKDFNIQTHFIVGNPTWMGSLEIEGFPISQITDSSANKLVELLSDLYSPVLLHYVGYGYAKRGCPAWLVDGLQQWKSLYPQRSLVTMFHEISASSNRPWESSFWLSSLQRNLAARLAQMSDQRITSCQSFGRILDRLAPKKMFSTICLPVFSNVGELDNVPPLFNRSKRLVTFGHKNSRTQIYRDYLPHLQRICESLNIEEICDIGNPTGLTPSCIKSVPIIEKGIVESSEISNILKDSLVGFQIFPPPHHLAKSTIFAAYCTYGLIPCMISANSTSVDGIECGQNYFSTANMHLELSFSLGQEISHNAHVWYQSHSLPVQAKIFLENLASPRAIKLL